MIAPYRSLLFVPGHRADRIPKAVASGADAVILDLEDAVAPEAKQDARDAVAAALAQFSTSSVGLIVRPNALDTEWYPDDLASVVREGATALLLPKLFDRDDVIRWDALIAAAELRAGLPVGSVPVIASFETARSLVNVDEIVSAPRVAGVLAAAARNADISREVGFEWTPEGEETLYLRSRVVLAARAAGVRCITVGLWQEIHNLDGLADFAAANRRLGFTGQVLIHPSHVDAVNTRFGLSDEEREYLTELVAAFDAARAAGHSSTNYRGEHIDLAHAVYARALLSLSSSS